MFCGDNNYLEFVRNNPEEYPGPNEPFEAHFEFKSLHYSVYRRFIELLYQATNHFFRKTSKHNYQQCLDLRGIEVGKLNFGGYTDYQGGLWILCGKMRLNLDKVPTNWAKLLVVTGSVFIDCRRYGSGIEKLDFIKKHKRLDFNYGYAEQLECLIHPGLEEFYINAYSLKFDHFLRCLNKLNVCQRLEVVSISNVNVKSAAAFNMLKEQLEQLAGRHPHAQIDCDLGYWKKFEIHQNVLCHLLGSGVFVKDYNFEDLRRYD